MTERTQEQIDLAFKKLEALEPLLYEIYRRSDKLGVYDGASREFEVTIDEYIWDSIKEFV